MPWKPNYVPPKRGRGSKISPMMLKFVDEYMVDLNGTQAVLRAGYGVSQKNANRKAAELMVHPHVKAEIEKRMEKRQEKTELQASYLIDKLLHMIEKDGTRDSDVLRAIELAGKSIALWKERQEVSGPDGEAIQMEQKVQEKADSFTNSLKRLTEKTREAKEQEEDNIVEFKKQG